MNTKTTTWYNCGYQGGGINNPLSTGRNLADIFNSEIAKYTSPWEWIQDRIDMGCYAGLEDEDFLPMALTTGEAHEMQIMGKNTYTGTTDQNLGNHIDFISRDCYSEQVQWNTEDTNNGISADKPYPYLVSNVCKFLNNDLYDKLPEDVKKVIAPKRTLLEKRYSASGALTESTGWGWGNSGNLWLPSEYEVFGSTICATKRWSAGQAVQYSIFANSLKNRMKSIAVKGERCSWWLLSVTNHDSYGACNVDINGFANSLYTAKNVLYIPICFRIAAQHQ